MASSSEYRKHPDGDTTVFDVTPAAGPKFAYMLFLGGVIVLISLAASGGFKAFMLVLGGLVLAFGWMYDPRPRAHRQACTFRVAPGGIDVAGRHFAKDDIHRLLLRNGVTDQELLTRYTENVNVAAGMAHRARAAQVANGLTLEADGKSTLLAGGMDETTAYGLLHDTCRILGFDIS